MTLAEALELAVTRTGHARFRDLLDPKHPDYNPAYEAVVRQIATGEPPAQPRPTVRQVVASRGRMVACPHYRKRPGCCSGAVCQFPWRLRWVTPTECAACLQGRGD